MSLKTLILLTVFGLVIMLSCKKDMNNDPAIVDPGNFNIPVASPVTGRITGIVVDENNTPVQAADVQLGTTTVITDAKGYFYFPNTTLDKYVTTVTVNKTGYFKALRSFSATASRNYVSVKLIPKILAGAIDASQGGAISLSNGTTITFPSGGIVVKATGTAYAGTVNVYASYIDPTAEDFATRMPGSMMGQDAGHMFVLQSTGMIAVDIESTNARALQLATGKNASIHLPIPSSLIAKAPANIDTWSLNDNGVWQKEGTSAKSGSFYDLEVSHFSFWNTDAPINPVYLTVHVQDQSGNPLPNLAVQIHIPGNTTWWATTYGITDSTGTVTGLVPAGLPGEISAVPNIYYCPNPVTTQNAGPFTSDTTLNLTVTLSSSQQLTINGAVTDCNSQPLASGYALINIGPFNQYNVPVVNGVYSLTTAYCAGPATINVIVHDGNAFTTSTDIPVTGSTVAIPSVQVCGLTQVATYESDGLKQFGSYIAGQSLHASHYMEAVVVVQTIGTYDISVQTNGMTFSNNGYFPRLGRDTVYLIGSGIPQATGYTQLFFNSNPGPSPANSINLYVYANTSMLASYTLGGPGYCSNEFIEGLFITGTIVDLSNTVTMLVNVTNPGLYSLYTDSVNGVRFTASGIFTTTGYQTVVMNGHGVPQVPGVSTYQVTGVSDACNFEVNSFSPNSMATYDISGSPGLCGNLVVHGPLLHAVPLTDQDYITIDLNVTTPGGYYISADNFNGVHFSSCGVLTNTGVQTVRLTSAGLCSNAGNSGFPLFVLGLGQSQPFGDGFTCSFSVQFN